MNRVELKFVKCYLVAMPIGDEFNDISLRALDVLKNSDFIFCESLDHCMHLNDKFGLGFAYKKIIHLKDKQAEQKPNFKLVEFLIKKKKDFVIISDSGIPCFVDPGKEIVDFILTRFINEVKFHPIGFSSVLDAILVLLAKHCSRGFFFDSESTKNKGINLPLNIFRNKLNFSIKNNLPFIFFVNYKNLNSLFGLLEKVGYNNDVLLVTNLSKKDVVGRGPVYKVLLGDLKEVEKSLFLVKADDDIVLALYKK